MGWNPAASPAEQWKLGRTRALLDLAGEPDRRLLCVLVAGTKGKGSTAAWLASILAVGCARVGFYSKPHLQSYRERVRVDGVAISPGDLADQVERFKGHVEALRRHFPDAGEPTTFEVTTALALDYFARRGCRVAVVEVGLGGRLDATNALEPILSLVTPISLDHTDVLGSSLAAIAAEKAGILRPGRPALLARQRPTAARVLARACRATGARCAIVPPLPAGREPATALLPGLEAVRLSLAGDHQRQNAALAVAAARCLAEQGVVLPDDAAIRGLERLRWPGRFEVLPGPPAVVLDGAHNTASAGALAAALRDELGPRPLSLVLGINRDKDARGVLRPLVSDARAIWATATVSSRRALPPEELAAVCRRLTAAPVRASPSVADALQGALEAAGSAGAVCVTGSLALVGQARSALGLPVPEGLWDEPDAG